MVQQARICLLMQETQKPQVPSLGREHPQEQEMATNSSVLIWRILWTEEPGLQPMGSQKSWTWLSKREKKHRPKTGPVMSLNRKGTRCQSTVPYGPARPVSLGFSVCFSITASICQGKKKKENDKDQFDWSKKKLGREISLPWSRFSANSPCWTPRSTSPLLLSGDENLSASMESPPQLQFHPHFTTKADK